MFHIFNRLEFEMSLSIFWIFKEFKSDISIPSFSKYNLLWIAKSLHVPWQFREISLSSFSSSVSEVMASLLYLK